MPSDLTIGLKVAADLTSGPQDQSPSGLDFVENNGPMSYNSDGVNISFLGNSYLSHPNTAAYEVDDIIYANLIVKISSDASVSFFSKESVDLTTIEYIFDYNKADLHIELLPTSGSLVSFDPPSPITNSMFLEVYLKPSIPEMAVAVNNSAWQIVNPGSLVVTDGEFELGAVNQLTGDTDMRIKLFHWYKGANVSNIINSASDRTWLYNSGAGRTYAEILATGTPPVNVIGNSVVTFSDSSSSWVVLASDGTGYASLAALHAAGKQAFPYLDPGIYPADLILDCQTVDDTASPGSGFFFAVNREDEGFSDLANDAARDAVATPVFSGQTFTYPCWTKKETILLSNVWVRKTGPTDLLNVTAVV